MRDHRLRQKQYALEVDVLDAIPVAGLDVEEFHGLGDAGVVDQNVDLTEGCDNGLNGFRAGSSGRRRCTQHRYAAVPDLLETLRSALRRGAIDIEDCNAGAFLRKPPGGREAYAARRGRTCNNCCFAAKQHSFLPWVCFPRRHFWQPIFLGNSITP